VPDVVLVIDDNPLLLETLGEALREEHTLLMLARDASEAVQGIERGTMPDAIVIDLDMRDGLDALARVETVIEDVVPVIALSSKPRRLLDAGIADAVVMKPFEIGHLRTCVRRACEQCRGAT
jgi:DNA-binding response OmpR family regulator